MTDEFEVFALRVVEKHPGDDMLYNIGGYATFDSAEERDEFIKETKESKLNAFQNHRTVYKYMLEVLDPNNPEVVTSRIKISRKVAEDLFEWEPGQDAEFEFNTLTRFPVTLPFEDRNLYEIMEMSGKENFEEFKKSWEAQMNDFNTQWELDHADEVDPDDEEQDFRTPGNFGERA